MSDEVEVLAGDGKDLLVKIHFDDGYVYEGWVDRISIPDDMISDEQQPYYYAPDGRVICRRCNLKLRDSGIENAKEGPLDTALHKCPAKEEIKNE